MKDAREDRLAAALRENLRRRKARARALGDGPADTPDPDPAQEAGTGQEEPGRDA